MFVTDSIKFYASYWEMRCDSSDVRKSSVCYRRDHQILKQNISFDVTISEPGTQTSKWIRTSAFVHMQVPRYRCDSKSVKTGDAREQNTIVESRIFNTFELRRGSWGGLSVLRVLEPLEVNQRNFYGSYTSRILRWNPSSERWYIHSIWDASNMTRNNLITREVMRAEEVWRRDSRD